MSTAATQPANTTTTSSSSFANGSTAPADTHLPPATDNPSALLSVPSPGAPLPDAHTSNTGLSGATAADADSIGRASKHARRSFGLGKRRTASMASSKRSQQHAADKPADAPPVSVSPSRPASTRSKAKKSGSGLLSCLPCFAPKEPHTPGDTTPPENVKQAQPLPHAPTSQSTPVKKQTPQTDSNALVPQPARDEKEGVAALSLAEGEKPSNGDGTAEHPPAPTEPPTVARTSSQRQPTETNAETAASSQSAALQTGQPPISSTYSLPVVAVPRPSVDQQHMIEDQTEEQKQIDNDIEMKDVPLSTHDVHQQGEEETAEAQSDHPKVDLPPPPPLEERQHAVQNQVIDVSEASEPQKYLLGPMAPRFQGKKCLVLDLDETLVHSSFKILHQADFTIPVEIEGQYHNVYVIKRPGVDQFMKRVGELYEVVVFTASVSKYGDPLLDQLDIHGVVHHRLFRESCYNHQGNYVKDLSQIGRDLKNTIIIDNSPTSYIFHPQHAVPISSWFSDAHDNELLDLIPVLEDLAGAQVSDVSLVLDVAL